MTDTNRDIAELLREGASDIEKDGTPSQVGPTEQELLEAADEIERLRAALKPFAVYGNFLNGEDIRAPNITREDLCKAAEILSND